MAELLVELLSEEIPARMQARAAADFKRLVGAALDKAQLSYERADADVTPRRLILVVDGLPVAQPDVSEERRGPRADAPEKAIAGFLKSAGLTRDQVEERETPKGTFLFAHIEKKGHATRDVLPALLEGVLSQMPWPKSMRWANTTVSWVRPLHGILAIFDGSALDGTFSFGGQGGDGGNLALSFADNTRGHRFLAPGSFTVGDFADYKAKLHEAKVMIDRDERRSAIVEQADRLASAEGLTIREDAGLLEEVVGLVEWPVVMIGRIDEAFMAVPPEVLITAMRTHQKYFSLLDASGAMAPRFVVVANTEASDGGKQVIAGNERVLRARLADAKFFWDQDRNNTLESRTPQLAERIFHAKLGTDFERVERIAKLAREWAKYSQADPEKSERAAHLCKADLMTEMVGELPELQGLMGQYYALNDGEDAEVAQAIADHYSPLGPGDDCPSAPVSVTVALADKIDTLAGFFIIDQKPTGSKDPFALRRAALGVIRLIVENGLRVPLLTLFDAADKLHRERALVVKDGQPDSSIAISGFATHSRPGWDKPHEPASWELLDFFADRLKAHLREQGIRHDLISAVFALGGEDDLVRLLSRVSALKDFLDTDDGANLLSAYRRASNIVRIEEKKDGTSYEGETEEELLSQHEETELYQTLGRARQQITEALVDERFGAAMAGLAGLRSPLDAFFDTVTVNCDNAQLRTNRLRLLSQIRSALGGVADFSHIEG